MNATIDFTMLQDNEISRRLRIFGLTQTESSQIVSQLKLWVRCSGPEWVITRLKNMKVSFLHLLANPDMDSSKLFPNIATNHDIPSGPFSRIFKLKKPQKVISALMVYSSLISKKVTQKQWDKFYKSASKEAVNVGPLLPNSIDPKEIQSPSPRSPWTSVGVLSFESRKTHSRMMHGNRAPRLTGGSEPWNPLLVVDSFNHVFARQFIMSNYGEHGEKLPIWAQNTIFNQYRSITNVMKSLRNECVGQISFIQEPGFKLRAVANPHPSLQMLMDPLKEALMSSLKKVPNDYCHRQEEAISEIQEELNRGTRLSSVDLSDATNNIPFTLQYELLQSLVRQADTIKSGRNATLELFKRVSKGMWRVDGFNGETQMSFVNGQALGTGPSFGSFSLAHHFIMRSAIANLIGNNKPIYDLYNSVHVNGQGDQYKYWIVGDDIVMDHQYASEYLRQCKHFDMPISVDKCLFDSNETAEFCSRVITRKRVIRQYKWSNVSDKNFLELAKQLGPKSIGLFRPKQQRILSTIGYIPDIIKGPVSWNPEGIPLDIRIDKYWDLAEEVLNSKTLKCYTDHSEITYQLMIALGQLVHFERVHPLRDLPSAETTRQSHSDNPIFSDVREIITNEGNYYHTLVKDALSHELSSDEAEIWNKAILFEELSPYETDYVRILEQRIRNYYTRIQQYEAVTPVLRLFKSRPKF